MDVLAKSYEAEKGTVLKIGYWGVCVQLRTKLANMEYANHRAIAQA